MTRRWSGSAWVVYVVAVIVTGEAQAFGTKRAHETLSDRAFSRALAASQGALEVYLRSELGLVDGAKTGLALQIGLTPDLDPELAETRVGEGNYGEGVFEGRLNRSQSLVDEDEFGNATAFPSAPDQTRYLIPGNCRNTTDFEACYRDLPRADIRQLLRIGTYAEDNPNPRSKHHFHDPERAHGPPSGNHGLDDKRAYLLGLDAVLADAGAAVFRGGALARFFGRLLAFPQSPVSDRDLGNFDLDGRSAVDRALDTARDALHASERYPANRFALPDAERYLHRALVAGRKDAREHFLALHFLAAGHVLHLLQDMGSVAHVRNDFVRDHVLVDELLGGTSLEAAGDRLDVFPSVLGAVSQGNLHESAPRRFLVEHGAGEVDPSEYASTQAALDPTGFDIVDFWDRGAFDASDDSDPARAGLAERVHNRFFSAGTVSNSTLLDGYARPLVPSCGDLDSEIGGSADRVRVANLPERKLASFERNGTERGRFLSSPLVPHLARCRFHALYLPDGDPVPVWQATVVDTSVQRDYLELLFPLVIDYSQRFLEQYFAARLEVVPLGGGAFKLANRTALPFEARSDAIEIAYDAADGTRRRAALECGGSGSFVLDPAPPGQPRGPASSITCQLPGSLVFAPANPLDFWVIVVGKLGARGGVVALPPSAVDDSDGWQEGDYVVAFQHVQPQILYTGNIDLGVQPATDASVRHDLYAVTVDLSRSLPPGDPGPRATNLTGPIREILKAEQGLTDQATAELDFGRPSSEPDGPRVALLADVDGTPGDASFIPAGFFPNEPWILDSSLSPGDTGAFRRIPLGSRRFVPRLGRGIAWDRDPTRKTIHYRTRDEAASREFFARYRVDTGAITEVEDLSETSGIEAASRDRLVSILDGSSTTDLFLVDAASGQVTHAFDMRVGERRLVACSSGMVCAGHDADTQTSATFSADGTHVAFVSRPGLSNFGTLFVANVADAAGNVIANAPLYPVLDAADQPLDGVADPAWSPDRRWIAFARADGNIWAVPSVGGDPIRLTGDGGPRGNLEWRGAMLKLGTSP